MTSSKLLGIKPEIVLYKLVISVEKVEDIKGPNFLKGKEGQLVTLYSKEGLSSKFYGEKIKAIVEYKGDERGGLFLDKADRDYKIINKKGGDMSGKTIKISLAFFS